MPRATNTKHEYRIQVQFKYKYIFYHTFMLLASRAKIYNFRKTQFNS